MADQLQHRDADLLYMLTCICLLPYGALWKFPTLPREFSQYAQLRIWRLGCTESAQPRLLHGHFGPTSRHMASINIFLLNQVRIQSLWWPNQRRDGHCWRYFLTNPLAWKDRMPLTQKVNCKYFFIFVTTFLKIEHEIIVVILPLLSHYPNHLFTRSMGHNYHYSKFAEKWWSSLDSNPDT